jgi:hypothetical protein
MLRLKAKLVDPNQPEAKFAEEVGLEKLLYQLTGLVGPVALGVCCSLGLVHCRHLQATSFSKSGDKVRDKR